MQADRPVKGQVLVVDDEEPVGRLLELWLIEEGYLVRRATSFEKACEWMGKESFDLVTLDIMMPVVDGLQALRWFRMYHPAVGVVMATALGDIDLVVEAMRLGAYSYMIKPFKMDLVAHEIARAMERQRLVAENRAYQQGLEQQVAEQTRELRAAYARLERQVKELEGRDRLVQCQSEGPDSPRACQVIMEVFCQVLGLESAVLYRPGPDREWLDPVAVLGSGGQVDLDGRLGDWSRERTTAPSLVAQAYRAGQAQCHPGLGTVLPLKYQQEILGVLRVKGLNREDQQEERNVLWRLGQAAASVLWAVRVKEQLDSGQLKVDELLSLE